MGYIEIYPNISKYIMKLSSLLLYYHWTFKIKVSKDILIE